MVQPMQVSNDARNENNVTYQCGPRTDKNFLKLHGKRRAFHKVGNSSCRLHIHQHYKVYKERCEKADIPISHWAIPWYIWRIMEEVKEMEPGGMRSNEQQGVTAAVGLQESDWPCEFMRANILQAVANLIATNNQVSC
jgi:hypothetical protein